MKKTFLVIVLVGLLSAACGGQKLTSGETPGSRDETVAPASANPATASPSPASDDQDHQETTTTGNEDTDSSPNVNAEEPDAIHPGGFGQTGHFPGNRGRITAGADEPDGIHPGGVGGGLMTPPVAIDPNMPYAPMPSPPHIHPNPTRFADADEFDNNRTAPAAGLPTFSGFVPLNPIGGQPSNLPPSGTGSNGPVGLDPTLSVNHDAINADGGETPAAKCFNPGGSPNNRWTQC